MWSKIIQNFKRCCHFLSPFLPRYCLLCLRCTEREIELCQLCEEFLPWLTEADQCDLPGLPANTRLQALFDYQWPLDNFIKQFKFDGKLHFAPLLAKLMAQHFPHPGAIDMIIPVPLHPKRQQSRGFNQCGELAKILSKTLNLPVAPWSCRKISQAPAQALLSAQKRKINVREQDFLIDPALRGKQVLVIEDVVTTGATIRAFSHALFSAGVARVVIWSCCRTR